MALTSDATRKEPDSRSRSDEWRTKALGDIFFLKHGFAFSSDFFCEDGGPIVLTPGNFRLDGGLYFDSRNTKRYAGAYDAKDVFNKGDLLIVMTDLTPDCNLLGKPAFVQSDETVLHNQRIGKVVLKDREIDRGFLYYTLLSREYLDRIKGMATGSTVRHTSNKSIYSIALGFPPTTEQRAIAAALSDVDALLGALDRLIAKKRGLKQAAMQQLLTGQTRLPGFSGKWETKRLGNFSPLQRGFDLPNPQLRPGPFPVVYSNGILNHHAQFQVRGPGVVTGRSGTIGKVVFVEGDYWPHNTSLWVTSFRGNNPRFVYYVLKSVRLDRFASGSGVPTLNRNDVHAFAVTVPSSIEEQDAIVAALTDIDAELTALEQRRDKTRLLKQGMMQELLSGRTRLV